jgi:hypothetical protein
MQKHISVQTLVYWATSYTFTCCILSKWSWGASCHTEICWVISPCTFRTILNTSVCPWISILIVSPVRTSRSAYSAIRICVVVRSCTVKYTNMRVSIVIRICRTLKYTAISRVICIWIAIAPTFIHASRITKVSVRLVAISDACPCNVISKVLGRTRGTQLCASTSHIFRIIC